MSWKQGWLWSPVRLHRSAKMRFRLKIGTYIVLNGKSTLWLHNTHNFSEILSVRISETEKSGTKLKASLFSANQLLISSPDVRLSITDIFNCPIYADFTVFWRMKAAIQFSRNRKLRSEKKLWSDRHYSYFICIYFPYTETVGVAGTWWY